MATIPASRPQETIDLGRNQTLEFMAALTHVELKAKHLSSKNFVSLVYIKRRIQKYFTEMSELEKAAAEAHGAILIAGTSQYTCSDKKFFDKLKEIQKKVFKLNIKETHFIEMEEFKVWVDNTDSATAIVLADYLLKDTKEKEDK